MAHAIFIFNLHITYDVIIDPCELEIMVPSGTKSYELIGDDYGLNPMRWFQMDEVGYHSLAKRFAYLTSPHHADGFITKPYRTY